MNVLENDQTSDFCSYRGVTAMPSRQSSQAKTRKKHVNMIVKNMSKWLCDKSERDRMATTDRVLPLGSLKRKCVKRIFSGWICSLHGKGRVVTKKLAAQVLRRLRKRFSLENLSGDVHVQEIDRLQNLLKQSRKRKLGSKTAMSSIDLADTLPMFEEEGIVS